MMAHINEAKSTRQASNFGAVCLVLFYRYQKV